MKHFLHKWGFARLSFSRKNSGGFTLVEVLVSLGIFAVLTGVVLSNYRGYNTNALFSNASEDIVLALRQAQVYGVGVKGSAGGSFTTPYGVHFNKVTPNQIIIFADTYPPAVLPAIPGDGKYTSGSDGIVETINWGGAVSYMTLNCGGVPCGSSIANVTFKRPDPDAVIKDGAGNLQSSVDIVIGNGTKTSTTTITSAGQISLQ